MTEAEKQRAQQDAEDDAKKLGLALLLALSKKDSATVRTITFEDGKFVINGRAVSSRSIIRYLEKITDRFAKRLVLITRQLENGDITLAEWKREFDRTITTGHVLKAALALGGIAIALRHPLVLSTIDTQLSFADQWFNELRKQVIPPVRFGGRFGGGNVSTIPKVRFSGFADDVVAETIPKVRFKGTTVQRIVSRAKLYNQSPHILFSDLQLEVVKRTGFRTEARNILRPAEHCSTSGGVIGCPELSQRGWLPVAEMVPIGRRRCGRHCRCFLMFR